MAHSLKIDAESSDSGIIDEVAIIFNNLSNKNNDLNSVIGSLSSHLSASKHETTSCICFKKVLRALCTLLRVKINTITCHQFHPKDSSENVVDICTSILQEIVDGKDPCIPVLCEVLCLSLQLLSISNLCEKACKLINECKMNFSDCICVSFTVCDHIHPSIEFVKTGIFLRIMESVITTMSSVKMDPPSKVILCLTDEELSSLLLKLIELNYGLLTAQVLLCVIPKLVTYTKNINVLKMLWSHISNKYVKIDLLDTNKVLSNICLIICMLADFYVPCIKQDNQLYSCVTKDTNFWKIIQCGIISTNPLIRKQSLYLLKRGVDNMYCNLCTNLTDECWWNLDRTLEFRNLWDDIFLLLEVLEEKQIHLIKPVQPVLSSLILACQQSHIHFSWILCIVQRGLSHECTAVVKWSIISLTTWDLNIYMTQDFNYSFLLLSLLHALNSSSIYVRKHFSSSVPDFIEGLKYYFLSAAKLPYSICHNFFSILLNSFCEVSWAPVSLFYVVNALAAVPNTPVWKANNVRELKHFLSFALTTQIVYIRSAVQCLFIDIIINLCDVRQLQVHDIVDLLGTFKRSESLKRGTNNWYKIVEWLKSFVTADDAQKFTEKAITSLLKEDKFGYERQSLARMIVLLADANLISLDISKINTDSSLYCLQMVLDYFKDCHKRLYINEVKQELCLELLTAILEESHSDKVDDFVRKNTHSLITYALPGIIFSVRKQMVSLCNLQHIDSIDIYISALKALSKESKLLDVLLTPAESIQEQSLSNIKSEDVNVTAVSKYCSIKCLVWVSDYLKLLKANCNINVSTTVLYKKQMTYVESILTENSVNVTLVKGEENKCLTLDLQIFWGKLVSEYLQAQWTLLNIYFELCPHSHLSNFDTEILNKMVQNAIGVLEIGGRGVLVPVMGVMKYMFVLFHTHEYERISRFISMCWRNVLELRKSDLFWVSVQKFVEMAFQQNLMNIFEMQEQLLAYSKEIFSLGDSVTGLTNILIQQLQKVVLATNSFVFYPFVEILMNALLFGPVHRRDQKVDHETCTYIRSLEEKFCVNSKIYLFSDSDNEVRAHGVNLILILSDSPFHKSVLSRLMTLLLLRDKESSIQKTRYFSDSYHHRLKHRIMQILIVIEPFLVQEERKILMLHLQENLLSENHQPSVRYLKEWLLIRILIKNICYCDTIWSMFKKAYEMRPGSLCSFIAVVLHVAHMLPVDGELETFIERGILEIIPWSMGQHFSVRLYAQVALLKLWELAEIKNLNGITKQYHILYSSIQKCLQSAGAIKNAQKLLEDFYFKCFHPLNHFSLQTIFYDLPRLTNITPEEWISPEVFISCGISSKHIPLFNSDKKLQNSICSLGECKLGTVSEVECDLQIKEFMNMQKKIIPWKAMFPDPELLLTLSETVLRRKQHASEEGLIVVASLIDRPTNLGGLSRTCEVFGVSQYVLDNLKYVEDKQFQHLSVTAEQWIPISEVKQQELGDYLELMKKKGYTIIGAEQTCNSILLHQVHFPKRTVLLLGNEKEGIPVNLLPLLDVCVEIPQQGVVRSLNVHVTGALFIWEYARQHFTK